MAVRTVPALRRRAADVQFVHGIGLLLVSTALVVNSGSHFAYVAADFIVIMSAQQAVFRVRHLLTVFALAFTFQLACSALRGDFWEPMNLAAIGIFGCGYLLAAIPAIRRIQLQDREIRLRLEAQRVKAALVRLVCFDAFTGLQNRTALQQCLQEFIEAARATGEPFAVLFIDLDRFKEINDTLGHGIGDQVLRAVSRRCEKIVEPRGVLARWGGDEFIALVRGPATVVDDVVERLLAAIAEPARIDEYELRITGSIGIASFPEHGDDPGELVRKADSAMYKAKQDIGVVMPCSRRSSLPPPSGAARFSCSFAKHSRKIASSCIISRSSTRRRGGLYVPRRSFAGSSATERFGSPVTSSRSPRRAASSVNWVGTSCAWRACKRPTGNGTASTWPSA
jgi:diguanylate cyclase (GGDEF)-like protein